MMVDRTLCANSECPIAYNCYRSERFWPEVRMFEWQSWINGRPKTDERGVITCDMLWDASADND